MLVIRLFRIGKKNQPLFKIIITDKRKPPRGGKFVEEVGFWNPLKKEKVLKAERIKYWISVGAKPSDTVYNLLVSEKIVEGKKIPVHKKAKEKEPVGPAEGGREEGGLESVAKAMDGKGKPVPEEKKEDVSSEASVSTEASAKVEAKEEKPLGRSPEATPTGEAAEEKPKPKESTEPAEENKEKAPKETPKEEQKPEEVK